MRVGRKERIAVDRCPFTARAVILCGPIWMKRPRAVMPGTIWRAIAPGPRPAAAGLARRLPDAAPYIAAARIDVVVKSAWPGR